MLTTGAATGVLRRLFPLPVATDVMKDNVIYIDINRTDSYTPNGTFYFPFKNWADAHASAVGQSVVAFVFLSPGDLAEKIFLNSNFARVAIVAQQGTLNINPASGNAFECLNNATIETLHVENLTFNGPVQVSGANGSGFCSTNGLFESCTFNQPVTLQCIVQMSFNGGLNNTLASDLSVENVSICEISGGNGQGPGTSLSVVTNLSHNQPGGFSGTIMILEKTIAGANLTCDSGSIVQFREGSRVGVPGGTIDIQGGILTAYVCNVLSDITISASGTLIDRGMSRNGALSIGAGSTYTVNNRLGYLPGAPSNWVNPSPNEIMNAIDRLAHVVSASGATPIP